jgi:hypothetical protein
MLLQFTSGFKVLRKQEMGGLCRVPPGHAALYTGYVSECYCCLHQASKCSGSKKRATCCAECRRSRQPAVQGGQRWVLLRSCTQLPDTWPNKQQAEYPSDAACMSTCMTSCFLIAVSRSERRLSVNSGQSRGTKVRYRHWLLSRAR